MKTEEIELKHEGIIIRGKIYLPAGSPDSRTPLVILCHGIPRGIPDPRDRGYLPWIEDLDRAGWATVFFNFRGTGESGGNFDLQGWTRDLSEVVDYCHRHTRVNPKRIVLLGFSGGAATSVCVAARDPRIAAVAACACPARFDFWESGDNPSFLLEHFRAIGIIRDRDFPSSFPE